MRLADEIDVVPRAEVDRFGSDDFDWNDDNAWLNTLCLDLRSKVDASNQKPKKQFKKSCE